MSKLHTVTVGALALFAVIFVLLNNKKQMAAQSQPEIAMAIPVRVSEIKEQPLAVSFSLVGLLQANNDVTIVAETDGRVLSVHKAVGDAVSPGSVLVAVDDELRRSAFTAAEVSYEKAKRDFERSEVLHKDSTISESQWEAARLAYKSAEAQFIAARRQLSDTKVTSPIHGVVSSRTVDVGSYVKHGDVIGNVIDISKLKVLVNVAERDVFKLKLGDAVRVSVDVYPGVTFDGTIRTISDKADVAHTYAVEVNLVNRADNPLKAGMFARAEFLASERAEQLAIPRAAVAGSLRDPHVYVLNDETASLRHVVVGEPSGDLLPVLSGLRAGELVVTSGQSNLRDGAEVTIVR